MHKPFSASNYFGDSTPILMQGSGFEQKLRDRMQLVVHNLENIWRCFQDVDIKKNRVVSLRAVEDVLRPFTRNLTLKDLTWIITRFSEDESFR